MKRTILATFLILTFALLGKAQNAEDCTLPVIIATTGAGSYCPGDEVTLTITGELNDATEWQWYTGSCGSDTIADEKGTFINVTVTDKTISYFVRGIGVGDDNCVGTTAECTEIVVVLDDEPPVANCPDNITVKNDLGVCGAEVSYISPEGTDNCSGDVTVEQISGLGIGALFPIGTTTEEYELTDANGNKANCSFMITVEDKEAPVISCTDDIETNNDEGECGAIVTYDLPTAMDNCTENVIPLLTEGLGSGAFFPVGTTIETYTATDEYGNMNSCSISITVLDKELPVITLSKDKTSKWPPNHKSFSIKIDEYIESVSDNCPGVSVDDIIIDEVSSDEEMNGSGDGNTKNDIVISDDCKTVHLLAERSGNGNGRVYTINLAVEDAHGNIGVAEIKAEISHDQGKKGGAIDDGPAYIVNGCDILPVKIDEEVVEEVAEKEEEKEEESSQVANENTGELNINSVETYPNPFKNSFVINYISQIDDHVSVNIFTLTGVKVKNLYEGDVLNKRAYSWSVDLEKLHDGVLLLLIKGEKTHEYKRIIQR